MDIEHYLKDNSLEAFYLKVNSDPEHLLIKLHEVGITFTEDSRVDADYMKNNPEKEYFIYKNQICEVDDYMYNWDYLLEDYFNIYNNTNLPRFNSKEFVTDIEKQEKKYIELINEREKNFFFRISGSFRTPAVGLAGVKRDGYNVTYIPKRNITEEIIDTVIESNGSLIRHIPPSLLTDEKYRKALNNSGFAIEFFPDGLANYNDYIKAVSVPNHASVISKIPKEFIDEKLFYAAFNSYKNLNDHLHGREILQFIPNSKVCIEIINKFKNEPDAIYKIISCIDKSIIDTKLANEAFRLDIRCIGLFPKEIMINPFGTISEREIECMKFVADDNENDKKYESLNYKDKSEPVSFIAVSAYPYNMKNVPKESMSDRIIMKALSQDEGLISYIDPKQRTRSMYLQMVRTEGLIIDEIPKEIVDKEFYLEAVKANPFALRKIDKEFVDNDILNAAFANRPPWEMQDEVWTLRYAKDSDCLMDYMQFFNHMDYSNMKEFTDEILINDKVASYIIQNLTNDLYELPERFHTKEYAEKFFDLNPQIFKKLKEEHCNDYMYEKVLEFYPDMIKSVKPYVDSYISKFKLVEKFPVSISLLDEAEKSYLVCKCAVMSPKFPINVIGDIPYSDLCTDAFEHCKNEYDAELFIKALENKRDIRDNSLLLNKTLNTNIVLKYPQLFSKFTPEIRENDKYLCHLAVMLLPSNYRYIGKNFQEKEVFFQAAYKEPQLLTHIKEDWKNEDFYKDLISLNCKIFNCIPKKEQTKGLCHFAYEQYKKDNTKSYIFNYIPYEDILLDAVRKENNKDRVMDIVIFSEKHRTPAIIEEGLKKNGKILMFLKDEEKNFKNCWIAVNQNPKIFNHIPIELRTPELCLFAAKLDNSTRKFVPEDIARRINLYSHGIQIDRQTGKKLSFKDLKDLYLGSQIRVREIIINNSPMYDCLLSYDKKNRELSIGKKLIARSDIYRDISINNNRKSSTKKRNKLQ